MHSIIVGTAGHIDHGKSALVRALTGKDPDRLPEEKRRGITIDLGFADLELGDIRIGFVDVPGHERFVKNMLAGAHGIDLVALVISADEGVMPQTREHFEICRLLGVKAGLIAITKADLVEEELIPLVHAEANELVVGSFLEGAPIVTVSAKTGAGLDDLLAALRAVASRIPVRSLDEVPRLPIDRAFTMKGFGAVVTGTLVSGEIAQTDEFDLLPSLTRVRARGLQVHGKSVSRARAGQRTAINLGGVDSSSLQRGMVLAPVARLRSTQILDVHLSVLPSAPRAIGSRARVRLHIHAAEVLARVQVLEDAQIAPGESGFVQFRLEAPIVAVSDERFIVRSYSPSQTAAGGQVLDPLASKHRVKDLAQVRERLKRLLNSDRATRLTTFVDLAGDRGQRISDLVARTGWTDKIVMEALEQAEEGSEVVDCEGFYLAKANFDRLGQVALDAVNAHHRREPLLRGLARETLRERHFAHTPPEIFRAVLLKLAQEEALISEKDLVRAREHSLELSEGDFQLRDRFKQLYENAGLEPPSLNEAMQVAGLTSAQKAHGRKILQLLLDDNTLVRIQEDLIFHRIAFDNLIAAVQGYGAKPDHQGTIDVAAFKELACVSRKYAIPLLEFLDRQKITRREGERRRILK